MDLSERLSQTFHCQAWQAENVVRLLDDGNTIPFIARYRKEATGNLDDQVLRQMADQVTDWRALAERKQDVVRLLTEQGALTPDLQQQIDQAETLTVVEDLYRPFRPKRRTRASIARERGLVPLAELIMAQQSSPAQYEALAARLAAACPDLADPQAALAGACDILAEQIADDPQVRQRLRLLLWQDGVLVCKGRTADDSVYQAFYDFQESLARVASHRVLAINRGEREEVLAVHVSVPLERALPWLARLVIHPNSSSPDILKAILEDSWKRLLLPSLANEVRQDLTASAQEKAIHVFAENLRALLMVPPIHGYTVLSLDPGFRTGCKLAVVDPTSRVLYTGVIYPTPPVSRLAEAGQTVSSLVRRFSVSLIAIGNGTASRETEQFVSALIRSEALNIRYLMVSEAGASVYSASKLAAAEFPDLDVAMRSAISIARRIQDPLAELVKIDPQAIGVGQYQHDLNQKKLSGALGGVVEDCVNSVGVDLNTASPSLLAHVAGISGQIAQNIITWREANGTFSSRQQLLKIPRLGPKAFEQCAGFLRIPGAREPLDNTSVHPESYAKVQALAQLLQCAPSPELAARARSHDLHQLAHQLDIGELTLADILEALSKPGRDPRDDLAQPELRSDVLDLKDLTPGMVLQGVVRNVADFGAFVDLGVHQDGLVHISELADQFVKNPHGVVRVGQAVKVRILSVDPVRKRIALSMKGLNQTHG